MPFWNDPHHVCFSGMTLIMYAFLERPSSCMLFWNDPHHVCFSGMTLIRKAYMMRVFPEKHA
jgi:ribosomal protein L32